MASFTIFKAKRSYRTPDMGQYLKAAQIFHWARKEDYTLYFHGYLKRDGRTERVLRKLKDKGRLRVVWHGKSLIYCAMRRNRKEEARDPLLVYHGLRCTRCLVAVYRSDMSGTPVSEKNYKHLPCVPEWGIQYPTGKRLLFEFCTQTNTRDWLKRKIRKYEGFIGDNVTSVLFVLDVSREKVGRLVERYEPSGPMAFTDYETFINIPLGQALTARIYFWWNGERVETLALR